MARDKSAQFLKTIEQSSKDMRAIVEALRIFGYINEIEYSELMTELTILSTEFIRSDHAETIEFARHNDKLREFGITPLNMHGEEDPVDIIPGMIPKEY